MPHSDNEQSWWLETTRLKDEYERRQLLRRWDEINAAHISTSKLKKILSILE